MNRILLLILFSFCFFCNHCHAQNIDISGGTVFEGEPFMAIDPANPQHIVIAWMSAPTVFPKTEIKIIATFNGGATWSTPVVLPHQSPTFMSDDVSMVFDHAGNVYAAYMDYRESPDSGAVYMVKSTNGGVTWGTPSLVLSIFSDGVKYPIDLPRLVIKRNSGITADTMYLTTKPVKGVAAPNRPYFTKSYDYGVTWSGLRYIDSTGYLVGPVIVYPDAEPAIDSGGVFHCVYPTFVSSISPDIRFIEANEDPTNLFNYDVAYTVVGGAAADPLAKGFGHLICDPTNTNHYAFFCIENLYGDLDVFSVETTNGGLTWSPSPIRVNDDAVGNGRMQDLVWANFDEYGDIITAWRDRRNAPDTGYAQPTEIWGAIKWKDSANYSSNFKISDTAAPFAAILDDPGNEFLNVAMVQDTMSVVWGDVRADTVLNIWFERKSMKVCTPPIATITPSGATIVCAPATVLLNANTGAGLTYQWEKGGSVISGATNSSYTASVTGSYNVMVYNNATCDSVSLPVTVTVNPTPSAISGNLAICSVPTTNLSDATTGGIWSSSNTSVATVSAAGVVTGVSSGSSNISYTVGSCLVGAIVTVGSVSAITGNTTICPGSHMPLSDATSGGTWSSSNTNIATVSATGIATGVIVGSANILYAFGTCPSVSVTVTVSTVAAITGVTTVCAGSISALSDATPGGVWSSSNTTVATVSGTGAVTGVASGSASIIYTLGSCSVNTNVTVNAAPAPVTGTLAVCLGFTTQLSDAVTGGVWSSTSSAIATITGGGLVSGVSSGSSNISYTLGSCSVGVSITVGALSVITGTNTVCTGSTTSLSDATAGGIWSSSNTAMATVSGTGIVAGVSAGSVAISYLLGSCSVNTTVTVNATPAPITGTSVICPGFTTQLSDAVTGGVWSSASSTIATISGTGLVSGASSGSANISYTLGSCSVGFIATAGALPSIAGPNNICAGSIAILSDATPGGVWSSNNTAIAIVSAIGVVFGISGGTADIFYILGSCSVSTTVTISGPVSPITGAAIVCAGSIISLSDASPGGSWSSGNTSIAVVGPSGVVTGVAYGTSTISYTISYSCGNLSATSIITVNPLPAPAAITGYTAAFCTGISTPLSDATPGGIWSSNNTTIATTNSAGLVTGVSAGSTTIYYSVTNGCGTVPASIIITVVPIAVIGSITGNTNLCVGSSVTLSDGTTGGTWSSSATSIAIIGGTGIITGIAIGNTTISYSVPNSCGIGASIAIVTVNTIPAASTITGTDSVCVGMSVILSDNVAGGVWSCAVPADAAVTSVGGVVYGIVAGFDTIRYTVTNICGSAVANFAINIMPVSSPACNPSNVGITGTTSAELKVFPNPNVGTFSLVLLSGEVGEPVTIIITTVIGQKVKEITTTTNTAVDIKLDAPAGIYLISASTLHGKYISKVEVY